ncbi:efflux RND transporter permease subunit [Rhodanobacter lindaniclasticus]
MLQPRRKKLLLVAALLLVAGVAAQHLWRDRGAAAVAQTAPPQQAVPVKVASAQRGDIDLSLKVIGSAQAWSTVTVQARVSGQLQALSFKPGGHVVKGDVIIRLDPSLLQSQLDEALGNLAKDKAQQANAQALLKRYGPLLKDGYVAKSAYDAAKANAGLYAAAVKADEAAVELARTQLGYATIRAPFDGIAGAPLVYPGAQVSANGTDLVVLNQVQPIHIRFAVPEAELAGLKAAHARGAVPVTARLPGSTTPMQATLDFIDNAVDASTGTIQLKARYANPDDALTPGQFVEVTLPTTRLRNVVTVPAVALQNSPRGSFVFVVDANNAVHQRMVTVGSGTEPYEAALKGAAEIGFTIFSMTISLVAVFLPVMFMGGIVGRLFHEFAVTISTAILISGFVSITLTPMLCSRFIRHAEHTKKSLVVRWFDQGFNHVRDGYNRSLAWSMARPRVVLGVFAASLLATALLFVLVDKDFIPAGDTGQLIVNVEGPDDISIDAMKARQQELAAIVAADPNVDSFMSSVGSGGSRATTNNGTMFLRLKPASERALDPPQIIQELRRKFAPIPGIRAYIQNPPAIQVGGRQSKAQYQYTLQAVDLDALYAASGQVERAFAELPGFQDVTSDLDLNGPAIAVQVDRARLAPLGLTMRQVQAALGAAFGANQVSTIYGSATQYWVILQVAYALQNDPAVLSQLYVTANTGALVPLSAVASFQRTARPLTVNHQGQLPAVTISFNLAPGVSLSQAVSRIDGAMAQLHLPATISGSVQGTAQAFQDSMQGMGLLLVLAVFVIYLVLGILYESFIHPLTILSGLPAAGVGALLTLMIFRAPLDLFSFVGIVMLIGIVKKNAIMLIDFALERQRVEGMAPMQAIIEACHVRFRPIMMTTMAAFAGTLPIALGIGAGASARRPLGLAVVGGLLVSQVLTLYLTPVIYLYMDRLQQRFGRKRTAPRLAAD